MIYNHSFEKIQFILSDSKLRERLIAALMQIDDPELIGSGLNSIQFIFLDADDKMTAQLNIERDYA